MPLTQSEQTGFEQINACSSPSFDFGDLAQAPSGRAEAEFFERGSSNLGQARLVCLCACDFCLFSEGSCMGKFEVLSNGCEQEEAKRDPG